MVAKRPFLVFVLITSLLVACGSSSAPDPTGDVDTVEPAAGEGISDQTSAQEEAQEPTETLVPTETAEPTPTTESTPTSAPTEAPPTSVPTEAPPEPTACELAVERAAQIGDMEDTVEDLDPAIIACDSLEEFIAATDKFPAALDGVDAELFASNRCLYSESSEVQNSAICLSLASD